MQAIAFSNNDIAIIAWTFDGRLQGCLGFAIYRTDVTTGTEVCLPALATFPNEPATPNRTTAQDPIQKFFWKDVFAKRGGSYRYRIVPMSGTPGNLAPLAVGSLTTDVIQLTGNYGTLSAFFNRGILATQATAHALKDAAGNLDAMKKELLNRIVDTTDPLRLELAGDMTQALTALPQEAIAKGGTIYGALYEYQDPELLKPIDALANKANIILSNMPGTDDAGEKTNDAYAVERAASKAAGVNVIDRMMPSGHIGHNKSIILELNDVPQAVAFGSTNFTSRALCAQSNNTIVARSPILAKLYRDYWDLLKSDTDAGGGKGKQAKPLRQADKAGPTEFELEDGSAKVKMWFSPNTDHSRTAADTTDPVDLKEVFDLIAGAKQAILFVVFEPGSPSIVEAIAKAQKANKSLFVRGTTTVEAAANVFAVGIKSDSAGGAGSDPSGKIPDDFRVIPATSVKDPLGQWEKELNSAGYAVTHSKYVVIDPFTPNCVVVTGSHNLGYRASYDNDENMAIIRGHRALSRAYAANALDIYDHYAWRWWLAKNPTVASTSLKPDDTWQNHYFNANGEATSPELEFWLQGAPASAATGGQPASNRAQPEMDAIMARTPRTPAHPAAARESSKRTRASVIGN